MTAGPTLPPPPPEKETDSHKLSQRQKQIDFGKNTLGYQNYAKVWPRNERCCSAADLTQTALCRWANVSLALIC